MFKKKPTIKAFAHLRSSDRRKIADEIIADLELGGPDNATSTDEEKAAERASLRNSLFPENIQAARFTTTAGPDLKQVSGTVYAGSNPGQEARILWVRTDGGLFPTVYTLWRNSRMLPLLHTPGIVVTKLQSGADLMTPGLANGPPFPSKAKKGRTVAVASIESPGIPLVVGVCEIDVSSLQRVQGTKGHAVNTVHWAGDELWAWSENGNPGAAPPASLEGWADAGPAGNDFPDTFNKLDISDPTEDGGVTLELSTADEIPTHASSGEAEAQPTAAFGGASDEGELTTGEVDDAFRNAFLYGVHYYKSAGKDSPRYGLSFPLTQSFVMSTLVQPFLPTFTPSQSQRLQIKNTSWKNIRKFIKYLDKQGLVKSKDRQGNEVVILDIDFNDPSVLNFKTYRLPKKDTAAVANPGRSDTVNAAGESADDPSIGQKLDRLELFKPKGNLASIFAASSNTKQLYSTSELRGSVEKYIAAENLVNPNNKRLIKLDPVLGDVFDSSSSLDKEVRAKGEVPRDALLERVRRSCSPFWIILRNDEDLSTTPSKPKSGAAPKISITLEMRSGNKTVTRVTGLEPYFIPPKPLAEELRKACASSTSVEQTQGSSPKDPKMEVMVQGPQRDAVLKALERRRINVNPKSGWVEVIDKTKKKK